MAKKLSINLDQIALEARRSWGSCKPCTRIHRSKKDYNRKDRSWRNDID